MARDDFTKPVIDLLQKRVAGRCSNPTCRRQTIGPNTNVLAVVNLGVAAHIQAASEGGPRYQTKMTREQRRDISNGIWLCSNCASLIDRDITKYSVEVLQEWKRLAEEKASTEQGHRLPDASDAVELLASAFTGAANRFIPSAVGNIHAAVASTLASLDSRFKVESEFKDGVSQFHIHAQEPVDFSIQVNKENAQAWQQGIRQFIDSGRPAVLPMRGIEVTGSRLLEVTMQELGSAGSLELTPIGKASTLKLFVPNNEDCIITEDIQGTLTAGRNAMHFEGTGYGELVKMEMSFNRMKNDTVSSSLDISFNFRRWQGLDVRQTPYLDKIYNLLQCLTHKQGIFYFHVEVEGNHALTARRTEKVESDFLFSCLNFVRYVRYAKIIAKHKNIRIPIDIDSPFTASEHTALQEAAETFERKRKYDKSSFSKTPSIKILSYDNGNSLRDIIQEKGYTHTKIQISESNISIFGTQFTLPPIDLHLNFVRLQIKNSRLVEDGIEFKLIVKMGPKFSCEYLFAEEPSSISPPRPCDSQDATGLALPGATT